MITQWEMERSQGWRERRNNLDEKEKLAEARQERQKAPEDTVVHVPEL